MGYSPLFIQNPRFTLRRRQLRSDATKAEQVLWKELRNRKLHYKFRRQCSLGNYIADFYCHELRLVIELDGPVHAGERQKVYDAKRTQWLTSQRYRVIRFLNDEVLFDRDKVLTRIADVCEELRVRRLNHEPHPGPLLRGEGDCY